MSIERRTTAEAEQSDADQIVRRSFAVTVKSIDKEARCVDVVASTDTIDAYDEVVDQSWDLSRYKRNPVVLWNHNIGTMFASHPSAQLPIGYSQDCATRMGQLEARLCFVDEKANPLAEQVWQGFLQGSIRAVSVGFNPRSVKFEKTDDKEFYRLSDNELYEISVCPMGANPDAVAKSRDAATKQLQMLAARPRNQSPAAPAAQQESTMTEKEIAELRAKLEEKSAALVAATKATETSVAQVADLTAKLEAKSVEATELGNKVKTLEESVVTLTTEKKEALARAAKAEDDILVKTVEDLVGKKILPAEKDEQLELARSNKSLFDKLIAKRPDLAVLDTKSALGEEKTAPATTAGTGNGEGLAAILQEAHDADAKAEKSAAA